MYIHVYFSFLDESKLETYEGQVRLLNGSYQSNGLLEVYLNKKWGTVCIEKFTNLIADITCRQLGYTNALSYGRYPW